MLSCVFGGMTCWLHIVVMNLFLLEEGVPHMNMIYVPFHAY